MSFGQQLIKGFISVALGAFGAHGLQKTITDPRSLKVLKIIVLIDMDRIGISLRII